MRITLVSGNLNLKLFRRWLFIIRKVGETVSSGNVVEKAEGELQKLKERHAELVNLVTEKEDAYRNARGLLGKRLLDGEGSLTELTVNLQKAERELRSAKIALKVSHIRIEKAERGLEERRFRRFEFEPKLETV